MKKYILQSLVILMMINSARASDVIETLIKDDKLTESEYISSYNEAQAIESAKVLIQKHKGTQLEPVLRHRLADLYVRQSQTRGFVEQVKKSKGKDLEDLFKSLPEKKELLRKAIAELLIVETQFPKYKDMDAVLYTMGMSYFKMNDVNAAERPFVKITKQYKNSPLLQDTRLSLGEVSYYQKNYKNAIYYFTFIAEDKNNKSQSYGFYKRSWSHFYLNQFQSAFNDLKLCYQVSLTGKDKLNLSKEALNEMPLFAAEIYSGPQMEGVYASFIKDKKSFEDVLDAQARIFSERSSFKNEIAVLNVLYKKRKSDAEQFDLGYRLAKAHESTDNLKQAAVYYKAANKHIESKIDEGTKEEFLVFGRNVVKQRYKEWAKSKKKFDLQPVVDIGDLGHIHIKDQNERAKFTNVLAELNADLKNFAKASEYYELSADLTKDSKQAVELMYSSIFSLEKSVKSDKWNSNQVARQRVLVDKYRKRFPNGNHMIDILYKFARVENTYGSKKIALNVFTELGDKYPNAIKGQEAQDYVVEIYNKEKNYLAINKYLEKVVPKTAPGSRKAKLSEVYDNSFFLMAQNHESRKLYSGAIQNYSDYLKKSVLQKQMPEAKWNIAFNYNKAGRFSPAADAYVSFYKTYPKHERALSGLQEAFVLYGKLKDLSNLEAVTTILEQNTKGVEQATWRFERAQVLVKAKKDKTAETVFYGLVKENDAKLNEAVHQYLFDHVDKSNSKFRQASLRVLQTGKEPFKSEAMIRVGIEYLAANDARNAKIKFESVLTSKGALAESKAKATIFIAEMGMKNLKMTLPGKVLNFDQAVKYLEGIMVKVAPITDQLQTVIAYKHNESSLRAYIKLSKMYLDLGIVLNNVEVKDKADLKLSIDREIRNLKTTAKTSFYESYEMALNMMSKDSKLRRKYNSELKKIRKEFDDFNDAQKIAMRGNK